MCLTVLWSSSIPQCQVLVVSLTVVFLLHRSGQAYQPSQRSGVVGVPSLGRIGLTALSSQVYCCHVLQWPMLLHTLEAHTTS